MKIALFLIVSILLNVFTANAQTTEFNYQGSLKDGANAANGNYDFEFLLFDALSGGSQVGSTLTRSTVAVANGAFSVKLDFGGQFPGANRVLEIHVRPAGGGAFTTLAPRQPVSSSPYAVQSLNAANAANATSATTATNATQLGGVAANQYVVTTDPRMIDSRAPTAGSSNYIQNSPIGQSPANFNVSGTGSADILNAATQFNLNDTRILTRAGLGNLFVGFSAGQFNTSGTKNTFAGEFAGYKNVAGQNNSFFGWSAGQNNTTGSQNLFLGAAAGNANTTESGNVYIGYEAGYSSTSSSNTFVGAYSGQLNTTGGSNTFLGSQTGYNNTQGINNTYAGFLAGYNGSTATQNAFFGGFAGQNNTIGGNNSFFGIYAGYNNTTGQSNTFIGRLAGNPNTATQVNSSTAIGVGATVSSDNTIVLGTAAETTQIPGVLNVSGNTILNGNVGVATNSPSQKLHVVGNGLFNGNVTVTGKVGIGTANPSQLLHLFQSGNTSNLISFGNDEWNVGNTNTGDFKIFRGGSAQIYMTNTGNVGIGTASPGTALEIRRDGTPSSDWQTSQLRISGATDPNKQLTLGFDTTTNAGVIQSGQAFTGYKILYINPAGGGVSISGNAIIPPTGNMSVSGLTLGTGGLQLINLPGVGGSPLCGVGGGASPYTIGFCSSSYRYKSNITKYQAGYDVVRRLNPIGYDWKLGGSRDIGLGAEDVEKIDKRLVFYNEKGQVEGVRYDRIGVVLINAVKEQQAQIEAQRELIERQDAVNKRQQAEIDALKKLVCSKRSRAAACR